MQTKESGKGAVWPAYLVYLNVVLMLLLLADASLQPEAVSLKFSKTHHETATSAQTGNGSGTFGRCFIIDTSGNSRYIDCKSELLAIVSVGDNLVSHVSRIFQKNLKLELNKNNRLYSYENPFLSSTMRFFCICLMGLSLLYLFIKNAFTEFLLGLLSPTCIIIFIGYLAFY